MGWDINWEIMIERHPLTVAQARQLDMDLQELIERAGELARMLSAAYGDSDSRTIRAQETEAALHRLQLEITRGKASSRTATG